MQFLIEATIDPLQYVREDGLNSIIISSDNSVSKSHKRNYYYFYYIHLRIC